MFFKLVCVCWLAASVSAAPPRNGIPIERYQPTVIPIISQSEEFEPNGTYKFSYETGNGIKREETAYNKVVPKSRAHPSSDEGGEDDSDEIYVQRGSYSYTAPDGSVISVRYIADENGFQPQGTHIHIGPQPPSSPAEKSARLTKEPDSFEGGSAPPAAVAPVKEITPIKTAPVPPAPVASEPAVKETTSTASAAPTAYVTEPVEQAQPTNEKPEIPDFESRSNLPKATESSEPAVSPEAPSELFEKSTTTAAVSPAEVEKLSTTVSPESSFVPSPSIETSTMTKTDTAEPKESSSKVVSEQSTPIDSESSTTETVKATTEEEKPTTETKSEISTTEADKITSEADKPTTESEKSTTEAEKPTTEAEKSTTTEVDKTTTEPVKSTIESEKSTTNETPTETDKSTTESATTTQAENSITEENKSTTGTVESPTAEPKTTTQPDTTDESTPQESTTTEVDKSTTEESKTTEAEIDTTENASSTTEKSKTKELENNTTEAEKTTTENE